MMQDAGKLYRAPRIDTILLFHSAATTQFSTHPLGCLAYVQTQRIQFREAQKPTDRFLSFNNFLAAKKGHRIAPGSLDTREPLGMAWPALYRRSTAGDTVAPYIFGQPFCAQPVLA